ncbi:MAG: hypothetical protein ACP5FK_05940 [bacterium]
MKYGKLIIAVVLLVLIFIIFAQNTEGCQFRILFWTVVMSRIVLMVLSLLVGLILGFILGNMKLTQKK